MQVKISQAIPMVEAFIQQKIVPLIVGSPGIGKSQIVYQIAKKYNLKVIDLRLAQCDPTDLAGFPKLIGDNKAGYAPMEYFPIEGDQLPKTPDGHCYDGWLLFLDELTSAVPALQAAAYKLILDRMVGNHRLHKNVAIVAAGNLETDNAIVQAMSTALQSRLAHIELVVDLDEWVNWAGVQKIDHRIPAYVKFKPEMLHAFKPDHTDHTYACPRTWEFANRVLKQTRDDDSIRLPMLAGVLSEGVAREFLGFIKIYKELPTIAQIEANPDGVPVSEEPSILWALAGSLSSKVTDSNIAKLLKYVKRIPAEFQVFTLRQTVRRNEHMLDHPAVKEWVVDSAIELF